MISQCQMSLRLFSASKWFGVLVITFILRDVAGASLVASDDAGGANEGEIPPFTARLFAEIIQDRGTGVCVATFIAPRVAVTAAHCVRDATRVQLVRGEEQREARVADYDGARDVCRLTVERDWPTTAVVTTTTPHRALTLAFREEMSPKLAILEREPECDANLCYKRLSTHVNETCRGDSGAPLLTLELEIAGVLSRGDAFCARATSEPLVFERNWHNGANEIKGSILTLFLVLFTSCVSWL